MSRSNPTPTNPAQHFFTWSGSKGRLEWYDKEKQKRIPVKLPFTFMVLDELATIAGFSEQDNSSYWSNEVRNITRDELIVKTSHGTKQVGFYKDLTDVRSKGAKYAKSIYIAHLDGNGDYVIGNIKASGAALTAWIELSGKYVVSNGTITLTGSVEGKKGTNTYHIPVFSYRTSTEDEDAVAFRLDKELQIYLNQYLALAEHDRLNQVENGEIDPTIGLATPEQMEDDKQRRAAAKRTKTNPEETDTESDWDDRIARGMEATLAEEDINLEDIPF